MADCNPYTGPTTAAANADPRFAERQRLLRQFVWHFLAAGTYSLLLEHDYGLIPELRPYAPGYLQNAAVLFLATGIRAWFCRNFKELLAASVAITWGHLFFHSALVCIQVPHSSVTWQTLIPALFVIPSVMSLVLSPILLVSMGRHARRTRRLVHQLVHPPAR